MSGPLDTGVKVLPVVTGTLRQRNCIEWRGGFAHGYGQLSRKYHGECRAHRWAYRKFYGDIPAGMMVCHSCDNPKCINPDHLSLGTTSENARQSVKRGRHFHARKPCCPICGARYERTRVVGRNGKPAWGRHCPSRGCRKLRKELRALGYKQGTSAAPGFPALSPEVAHEYRFNRGALLEQRASDLSHWPALMFPATGRTRRRTSRSGCATVCGSTASPAPISPSSGAPRSARA